MNQDQLALLKAEGWTVERKDGKAVVEVDGYALPAGAHPFAIHAKIYREDDDPEIKYQHLKRMHDILWPQLIPTWHRWDEIRLRTHCEGYSCISYAGGASTGKSSCAARIAVLFWVSNPANNACIISSTTLESLNSRIFGYIIRFITQAAIELPYHYLRGKPPKILFNPADNIHGVFAVAAKQGGEDQAIKDLIGRHPNEGLLVCLDEATDQPLELLGALPNLDSGSKFFQLMLAGNSKSKFDLHGSLSTPKDGWKSIDPLKDNRWLTTAKNGICLLFSCYESPAIYETDPVKKELLSKFLITQEQIEEKRKLYGEDSAAFYRFVIGAWAPDDLEDNTVISSRFIQEFNVTKNAEWSGLRDLTIVAGLDPAFSTGGDQCILRLGVLGQDVNGRVLLDFRFNDLLFKIKISATTGKSAELQIADQVIDLLNKYRCPLSNMCVDANGQGRALAEVIRLRANSVMHPIKIYTVRQGQGAVRSFDVVVKTSWDLWSECRKFIQTDQIRGIDPAALNQLTSRLVKYNIKTGKQEMENKRDYKMRIGAISPSLAHSPDEADALALCLQAAIINYGFTPGQRLEIKKPDDSFATEKLAAIMNAKKIEEDHAGGRVSAPPIANFSADIYSIISVDGSQNFFQKN